MMIIIFLREAAIRVWQPGERRQRRRVLKRWPTTKSAARGRVAGADVH
jgi:hypothetical protein